MRYTLHNAVIVTGASSRRGALVIDNGRIAAIRYEEPFLLGSPYADGTAVDLQGRFLFAGGIDAHVHFREPGLTHKGDIASESRAALLGGITAFIDMPNTIPPATTQERLLEKCRLAAGRSWCHYAFHRGAANDVSSIQTTDFQPVPGISPALKVFLGSSTGNLLVNDPATLEAIFRQSETPVFVHSEDETIIRANLAAARQRFGDGIPIAWHPQIRSREACIASTRRAIDAALRFGTHLHILHVSTEEEAELIRTAKGYSPHITAETGAHYLWFCDEDYERLGMRIRCNPAIKTARDREALIAAVRDGTIDTLGSDHAPHLLSEKERPYLEAPSGIPSIQESLSVLLTVTRRNGIPATRVASLISERIADILRIEGRGHLVPGNAADLIVVDPDAVWTVGKPTCKCGWSPFEGETLTGRIDQVWLAGVPIVSAGRLLSPIPAGQPLRFRSPAD